MIKTDPSQHLKNYPLKKTNEEWANIIITIKLIAKEVLGEKNKNVRNRGLKIWNKDIHEAINEEDKAYKGIY